MTYIYSKISINFEITIDLTETWCYLKYIPQNLVYSDKNLVILFKL